MDTSITDSLLSQLYDIYDPLPLPWWQNPWSYVGAIIACLLIALCWRLYKKMLKSVKTLTYWEQALSDLAELEHRAPMLDSARLYQQLTDIFKSYAQTRFKLPLVDKTDNEILLQLPHLSVENVTIPSSQLAELTSLFEQGPLIKFGKVPVPEEQRTADISLIREIIQTTCSHEQKKA